MRFLLLLTRKLPVSILVIILLLPVSTVISGERLLIQLKDFTKSEFKAGGFILPDGVRIHIYGLGGSAGKKYIFNSGDMYAYGWIINADTRELVWEMDRGNTTPEKEFRKFDDQLFLKKGSYEVYFTAYGYASVSGLSNFNINIDRRKDDIEDERGSKKGLLSWLEEMLVGDKKKEWGELAKNWEISIFIDDRLKGIDTFSPPKEFPGVVYKRTHLGENEHVRQRFRLNASIPLRIYAFGEKDFEDGLADFGWISNMKTHKRIWELRRRNADYAGGADKNVKSDEIIELPAGDYILYYSTDGSHSYRDWNAPPPYDPYNYGITLMATSDGHKDEFKLVPMGSDEKNIIVQLTRLGNDQTRNSVFMLKEESTLRIYAIGERSYTRHQMADYGWIINTQTREKVWTMDEYRTAPAGGADKNRMIDEVIVLPAGTYKVFYQTDDSHSYNDWNAGAPADDERWGITIYGEGENFNLAHVEKNVSGSEPGIVAQIIHVGDDANEKQSFKLNKTERLRVYAIGEGQNREMYDYGWIENATTGEIVWEMTYSMTFHAGGARKNRSVNNNITLDKGNYILRYVSDDSHSFNRWNSVAPDDPTMWGITLYKEK